MGEPRSIEVNRVREVLRQHWLSGIVCDHEQKTDVAACFCCEWRSPVLESPVAAANAWIDHVIDQMLKPGDSSSVGAPQNPTCPSGAEEKI